VSVKVVMDIFEEGRYEKCWAAMLW
jgi:hypothetical protein